MFIVETTNRWRFINIIIIFRSKLLLNFVLNSSYKERKVIIILIINIIKKKIITVKSIFLFTSIIFPEDFSNKFK